MSDPVEETVIAYVDGCMDGEAVAAFEAKLAEDPVLAERVSSHRWMARQIVAAYGPPPEEGVDETLIARLGLGNDSVAVIPGFVHLTARRGVVWTARFAALAASLVVGIFVGQRLLMPDTSLIPGPDGQVTASGVLATGLSNQLAGEQGAVLIGVSFRTATGICRTFRTTQGLSGLGCREGAQWRLPVIVSAVSAQKAPTEYQLASGEIPSQVMAEVDRRIKGEPLTKAEETRLKAVGWR
ncbi:hypothetical protein KRR38_32735 [Novosphingobium sp. G106]|uniref:anti-sigma factor family protein n=1 Tax=Novosphingobium sp. G106 TaxID=2849500 RepID=UPI001C2DA574|nr:hypothetical protein [Novosphingobium sp. G106]MBV1692300.1 hypothetical protein [Novosphingobium sp. G106]